MPTLSLPALLPLYAQVSPDTYGGAMLLGVEGVCIISHGSSNSQAMLNAIKLAHEMVEHRLVDEIRASGRAARVAGRLIRRLAAEALGSRPV